MASNPHLTGKVAGGHMAEFDFTQSRFLSAAKIAGIDAAGVKSTARGRIDRTGDIAFENDALVLALRQPASADREWC